MMTLSFDHKVHLEAERCFDCGRWWAQEPHHRGVCCPYCAREARAQLCAKVDSLNRSNAALRGVTSKRAGGKR